MTSLSFRLWTVSPVPPYSDCNRRPCDANNRPNLTAGRSESEEAEYLVWKEGVETGKGKPLRKSHTRDDWKGRG